MASSDTVKVKWTVPK